MRNNYVTYIVSMQHYFSQFQMAALSTAWCSYYE